MSSSDCNKGEQTDNFKRKGRMGLKLQNRYFKTERLRKKESGRLPGGDDKPQGGLERVQGCSLHRLVAKQKRELEGYRCHRTQRRALTLGT